MVIGETSVIGDNVYIMHDVTLGAILTMTILYIMHDVTLGAILTMTILYIMHDVTLGALEVNRTQSRKE